MKIAFALVLISLALISINASASVTPIEMYEYIQRHTNLGIICEDIPISTNASAQDEVQHCLDQYKFTKEFTLNVFDCSDMSQLVWFILKEYGYNATMMYGMEQDTQTAHVWVKCDTKTGETLMIECTNKQTIGIIVNNDNRYNSGLLFNSSHELNEIWPDDGIVNDANIVQMKQTMTVRIA